MGLACVYARRHSGFFGAGTTKDVARYYNFDIYNYHVERVDEMSDIEQFYNPRECRALRRALSIVLDRETTDDDVLHYMECGYLTLNSGRDYFSFMFDTDDRNRWYVIFPYQWPSPDPNYDVVETCIADYNDDKEAAVNKIMSLSHNPDIKSEIVRHMESFYNSPYSFETCVDDILRCINA